MYSDWTTQFFNGLAVEFWDRIAPAPTPQEIEFLRGILGSGGELLDLASGSGRFSIPLAAAGYRVTAIDISDDFLALGRARDASIDWHRGDIRDLPWTNRFDGAVCFGNSFGYFPRGETIAFLQGVARALQPRAPFVFDTGASAESLLPALQRERRIEAADFIFSSRNEYAPRESRLDIEYTIERKGAREVKTAQTFVFSTGEICSMLEAAGFRVASLASSAAGDPFVLGSPRALFVARRGAD